MARRLHTGGKTRAWLGRRFGGDERLGDRIWRRCLHLGGVVVLIVYVVPRDFFVVLPTEGVLLLALAAVLVLEFLRRRAGVELPTIRPHEEHRVASYAYFAVGLSLAVLIFPKPVAVAAVLGAVLVDPLMGELRAAGLARPSVTLAGVGAYVAVVVPTLLLLGAWPLEFALAAGIALGLVGALVEGPASVLPIDDDLAMPLLPGLVAAAPYWIATGAIHLPAF